MTLYLSNSEFIDWKHPTIQVLARQLAQHHTSDVDVARKCFEYVRDQILHSWDYQLNPVTCKASDVLLHKTGFCYAKSHLLAALLRANKIPSGLCYQRLTIDGKQAPFCLHGLNTIHLKNYGWYRVDARGNNSDVEAEFCPPHEKLAFPIAHKGEFDLPEIWAEPLPAVANILCHAKTYIEVSENLPDLQTAQ